MRSTMSFLGVDHCHSRRRPCRALIGERDVIAMDRSKDWRSCLGLDAWVQRDGLRGSTGACWCALFRLSLSFLPLFLSVALLLASEHRGTRRAGMRALVHRGWLLCGACAGGAQCGWIGYLFTPRFIAEPSSYRHWCWVYARRISLSHSVAYCGRSGRDGKRDGYDAATTEQQQWRGHRKRMEPLCVRRGMRVCARGGVSI
ncbi:hypothetical protein B0H13DRAFT_772860 [Mycena leptocephala]|nr:hypothetical protein B0H13DRAFT_772860 [Mycena leptocephala]